MEPMTSSTLRSLLLLLLASQPLLAQYYDEREYSPVRDRFVHAGFLSRTFEARSSNPLPDSLTIGYDRIMPTLGFRQGPVDATFGYARFTLRGRSRSTIFFGVTVASEVPLAGKRPGTLLLPFLLSADYTKAEAGGTERDNFNIGSIGIGAGLKYRYQTEAVDMSVQVLEVVHFSSEGFSAGTGFSAATLAEAGLLLRNIGILDGMALGYRFRFQTWSMSEERFDYRTVSHGPYVGVLF